MYLYSLFEKHGVINILLCCCFAKHAEIVNKNNNSLQTPQSMLLQYYISNFQWATYFSDSLQIRQSPQNVPLNNNWALFINQNR